jgi:oligopeptide transport system ATP-binding protein
MDAHNLVEVTALKKYFPISSGMFKKKNVQAVEDVSLFIRKGETLGLVGETGCGKTTFGRALIRLYSPTSGKVVYDGKTVFDGSLSRQPEMKPFRRKMQIIFQDPAASLNPRMTVGEIVCEPLEIHKLFNSKKERMDRVRELLEHVGLNSEHANRYPHEFSGGQQQRIGIARALAVEPEFIVCDEPISALDVSIQSQIVNMLEDMQENMKLTFLFISHDLSVIRTISNRVGVMYLGQLVELGGSSEIYNSPLHPYTKTLLSAVPIPDPDKARATKRIILEGDLPSPIDPPSGCRFHTRCMNRGKICKEEAPNWREVSDGHFAACHNLE